SRSNFNFLHNREIEAVIPPRENSSTLSRGSPYRAKTVRRIRRTGLDAWKKEVDYGKRWRVEIFFSALKRVVGEVIMAKKMMYQIQEAVMKIYTYFLLRKNAEVN
ncbi:MAG: IS5/IS1182 family transposase, partial [Candidatus Thermoplasmatota archaeon]|nr:IS5/IS1182 family transposase [Candidatus Thermoplasmatota archaeon]